MRQGAPVYFMMRINFPIKKAGAVAVGAEPFCHTHFKKSNYTLARERKAGCSRIG